PCSRRTSIRRGRLLLKLDHLRNTTHPRVSRAMNAGDGERAARNRIGASSAHDVVAMPLEQFVEFFDSCARKAWLVMRDLREKGQCVRSHIQHLLPLLVQLGALAMNG